MEYVGAHRLLGPAAPAHYPPPPQMQMQTQSTRTQRRVDLEQEVADLKKQLWNEQAVHQILERALLQPINSSRSRSSSSNSSSSSAASMLPSIPPPAPAASIFIPPKAKELLAELVLVEEEIARLENQILTMKQQQQPQPSNSNNNKGDDANIKSMFFISQAINKADFLDRHRHHPIPNLSSSPKLNNYSLLAPQRQKQQQQQRTTRIVQPNKLSERILKCLVCIFTRLHRSSRVADLDKSANLHPQPALAGGGSSFRTDTSASTKDSSSRSGQMQQQDPYGIFAIQDSIVRDIGPYKNLVRFTSSSFDLRGFSTSPLLTKLRGMLEDLQHVDLRCLTHHQKLAFWLNIYNICIMHGILHNGLPSNSENLLVLKNKATLNVSGQKFNALVIENFILRQPSSVKEEFWKCDVDVEEQQVRSRYGLNSSEPNILFALCCGIRSSPALRIYKADRVVMELEKAKLEYLQASLVVTATATATARRIGGRVMIPRLIECNMHDVAKDMDSLLRWICEQLPTSCSLRKSMLDCLTHHHLVHVIPYDYDFQYLLPIPM